MDFRNGPFISPFECGEQTIDYSNINQNIQYNKYIYYINLNLKSDFLDTKANLEEKSYYSKKYVTEKYIVDKFEESDFPIFIKYNQKCYPLIKEDNYNLKKEKIIYNEIYFPSEKEINKNYYNEDWYSEEIYLTNAKKKYYHLEKILKRIYPMQKL